MILIDTREKPEAIKKIVSYFESNGIEYDRTKLYFGDYRNYNNPHLVIDRKRSIAELAQNVTIERDRFRRELEKVEATGSRLIILVEQDYYSAKGKTTTRTIKVKTIHDLYLWKHPKAEIYGDRVARILYGLSKRYPIEIEFCNRNKTGKRIMEILGDE